MAQPFVGEIKMFGGNFAPASYAFCDGRTLAISQNDVLFQLIGTTYGGDGQQTFNLPNLCGRVPIHMGTAATGTTYVLGEQAGTETVTLTTQQIPNHNHAFLASKDSASDTSPQNNVVALSTAIKNWSPFGSTAGNNMNPSAVTAAGGSQPHENMMPYLVVSFIIALFGIFPTQN